MLLNGKVFPYYGNNQKIRKSRKIKSIDKALNLLEFLSDNGHEISIVEINKS